MARLIDGITDGEEDLVVPRRVGRGLAWGRPVGSNTSSLWRGAVGLKKGPALGPLSRMDVRIQGPAESLKPEPAVTFVRRRFC